MGNDWKGQPQLQVASLNTTPLYIQLRDLLIERIQTRAWTSGRVLPNEVQLANEFSVSVGTIRKTMDELSSRGLVVRMQGRGTFVADTHDIAAISVLAQICHRDGSAIVWDPPHTSVTSGPASREEQVRFAGYSSSTALLRFEWLGGSKGRRMVLQKTSVPTKLVEIDVEKAQHIDHLGELFSRSGILVERTEVALSVAPATLDVATRLKVDAGVSLLHLQRRFLDLQGRPVAISDDWLALKAEVYTHVQHRAQS